MGWGGHLFLDTGSLFYSGPTGTAARHAHHAFHIVLATATPIRVASAVDRAEATSVVIPPDVAHAFETSSSRVAILYVAPESRAGRCLTATLSSAQRVADWIAAAAALPAEDLCTTTDWHEARRRSSEALDLLIGTAATPRPWPPAIRRLVAMLPDRLDAELRFAVLARELGLSESRLAHLVTEHLGIPFRPYVLWLRLQRAASEMARGHSITDAAHAAGFSDGSHLTRAFRRMFGITPSEIAGAVTWHLPETTAADALATGPAGRPR
jgi:AraC-like DNA-binding protein